MAFKPKKIYEFSTEDEKKVFNLILKSTLEKEIEWSQGKAMFTGIIGKEKILFYEGETRDAISIQNKTEYAFFVINKEQKELLKKIISGKVTHGLPQDYAVNIWNGKQFLKPSEFSELNG